MVQTYFKDAFTAWKQWNLADFDDKHQHLLSFHAAVEEQNETLANLVKFHLTHAKALLKTIQLAGPTGESNELYTCGRGVTLVLVDDLIDQKENTLFSTFSFIITALISGNSLIICTDNVKLTSLLTLTIRQAQLPTNLIGLANFESATTLVDKDIRTMAYIGTESKLKQLNEQLARRKGAIVNLVYETNLAAPRSIYDPLLALEFITERTRTINITAVGGNATLLEMGK